MSEITQLLSSLIGNLGFPIACVVAMFYMWNKEREEHKAESAKWVEAINRNTEVIANLTVKLGVESNE